ncbi:eukaryotic translation initiation factor 3 subunit J-A [Lampris incognitus]|uniref:eukaryotic translation initiation factor 3 subunit J-A n=1 Tax=Lampris incognitus TaxID=2546036 RepID=UPI0024B51CDA|nr:eukaryotic translation initiation factor 3 subunit J-A [Lampris incognitus]
MAEADSWDAESFEPDDVKKPVAFDKWEGEDEEEDVKDNWDDEEEELKDEEKKTETTLSTKKKLNEKIKEKEDLQRKKQMELKIQLEESQDDKELTPEEDLAEKLIEEKLQEDSLVKLDGEAFGVSNNVTGIDGISPSSKDDFTEFEKLLKDKISPYEKSIHYSGFLESLFRDLCLSLEVEDLKKINASITVLLSEKQKQEKQLNKGKKKKKGTTAGGGLKAKMKDDLADYGELDGGYTQDYEDFM